MEPSISSIQGFQRWFLQNGGILHDHAEFVEAEDGQYNVQVSSGKSIEDDALIVSCPTTLAFSFVTYAVKDQVGYISKIDRTALKQDVVLRLTLMEQHLLGKNSFWWPYLNVLPQPHLLHFLEHGSEGGITPIGKQSFHTPVYFSEEDMLWLKGTNLGAAAETRASEWREEFENVKDSIKGLNESQQALWTSDLYIWAATILTTRSFSASALRIPGLDSPVLIPGIDMLNHSPHAKVTWNWGPAACSVETNNALQGEDEIFNNYGSKSNEELLMGYGFCLESNNADSFNLSYAPELSQNIKAAKACRATSRPTRVDPEIPTPSSAMNSDDPTFTDADDDHVEDVKFVSISDGDYHFCPGFLADCSLALQNSREKQQDIICSPLITRFSNDTLSRNKLHTISSIIMILQQKQMEICKHDGNLPPIPKNQSQVFASIYRSSQLKIIEGVLQGLSSTLQSITQLRIGKLPRIIHLGDILEGLPKALKRHLREVLHAGVRTREANKIAERGGVKFAFAMWLCGLRLLHMAGTLAECDAALSEWVDFLLRYYNHHDIDGCTCDGHDGDSSNSKSGEMASTARSYANAIQIAVGKHPDSIYNNEWSLDLQNLVWCVAVVKEEGVRCPTVAGDGILGEEKDEFVMVIDAESAR